MKNKLQKGFIDFRAIGLVFLVILFMFGFYREYKQDIAQLESDLEQKQAEILGGTNEIPTVVALFETTLASSITKTATSMTLTSATDKDGNALASSTYAFIIDEGTASEEFVIADCTSTACTNMTRGVSVLTGTTTVSALRKSHRRGSSVKITDGPQLLILSRILNGQGTLPNILSYSGNPTFTASSSQLATVSYVDNTAFSGSPNATESTKGIIELATQLEMASTSPTGTSGASLVLQSKYATSSPDTRGLYIPVAENDGYLKQAWLDLTENWTISGLFSATATSTMATTTISELTISNDATVSGDLSITGSTSIGTLNTTTLNNSGTASTTDMVISGTCTGCGSYHLTTLNSNNTFGTGSENFDVYVPMTFEPQFIEVMGTMQHTDISSNKYHSTSFVGPAMWLSGGTYQGFDTAGVDDSITDITDALLETDNDTGENVHMTVLTASSTGATLRFAKTGTDGTTFYWNFILKAFK